MRRIAAVLGVLTLAIGACGGDGDAASRTSRAGGTTSVSSTAAAPQSSTTPSPPASDAVAPGRAVLEAGGERWEFAVDTCLVGHDQTGSPYSRLSLSGQLVEDGDPADGILTVSVLVSRVAPGHEEHVISVYRPDGPSLGAADLQVPSRGGPAPDDWIEVGDGVVSGSGFELWEIEPGGERFPPGTLVADCPAAAG